ncbi:MAG: hypothetical protein IIA30_02595 [Myxococcales bacterium]|nr:hypothetical protein [Myxococcales bacterium]
MEGVGRGLVGIDAPTCRNQGLSEHLAPEDPLGALLGTVRPKDVHLQLFHVEEREQLIE